VVGVALSRQPMSSEATNSAGRAKKERGSAERVLVAMGVAWLGRTPHPADDVSTDHPAATSQQLCDSLRCIRTGESLCSIPSAWVFP